MPLGSLPVLAIQGPQGSGKSTTAKRLRSLFDPRATATSGKPKSPDDIMVSALNNRVLSYDNISSGVDSSLSDTICILATGGGMAKRALYTNFEEVSMSARRSTILNGIDDLAVHGDLAQRTLTVNLKPLHYRSEREMDAEFESARPRILGALLDAVSMAVRRLPEVSADEGWERPRMVDFAEWVVAAEPALAIPEGSFLKAYAQSQEHQRIDMMEGNALAIALKQLADHLEPGKEVNYSAEELLNKLLATRNMLANDVGLPRSAKGLSQFLRRDHADYERATGLVIKMDPHDRDPVTRRKQIRISLK